MKRAILTVFIIFAFYSVLCCCFGETSVMQMPESIMTADTLTIEIGETIALSYEIEPADALGFCSFSIKDNTIADLSSEGSVTGRKEGHTTITLRCVNGIEANVELEVIPGANYHKVLNIAHRGASGDYPPGNTIEAFSHSREQGADCVELDVQKSKDDILFIRHDNSITQDGKKYKLAKCTYDFICQLDPNVCTLDEALDCLQQYDLDLIIELKVQGIEAAVRNAVERKDLNDRVYYSSFILDAVNTIKEQDPNVRTVFIPGNRSKLDNILGNLSECSFSMLMINHKFLTANDLTQIHSAGMKVIVSTVDKSAEMRSFIELGVDAVLTNYPSRMDAIR